MSSNPTLAQVTHQLRQAHASYDAVVLRERIIWEQALRHAETAYNAELTAHDALYARAIEAAAERMRVIVKPTWEQYRTAMHDADMDLQAAIRKFEETAASLRGERERKPSKAKGQMVSKDTEAKS